MSLIADVAADRGAGSSGARPDHDPLRNRMLLVAHLDEYRLRDVVVAAPIGGSFGVGELVQVVPTSLLGDAFGLGVEAARALYEMATATLRFDQCDLGRASRRGHHRDERETQQCGEVR